MNPFPFLFTEPALTISFRDNKFPSKIDRRVLANIPKNPPSFFFVLFLFVSVTPFSKTLESSRASTIFIISFISLFQIIKVVVPEPCVFF